jgi:hypothetical protein
MQTFWLEDGANSGSSNGKDASTVVSADTLDVTRTDGASSLHTEKVLRLINWNVDILLCLLKQVAAKRSVRTNSTSNSLPSKESVCKAESRCARAMPLNEVQEIIRLPNFSTSNAQMEDIKKITLNPAVEKQLFDYVSSVATMYRDNPFHNFEHVSEEYTNVQHVYTVSCNLTPFSSFLSTGLARDNVGRQAHVPYCGFLYLFGRRGCSGERYRFHVARPYVWNRVGSSDTIQLHICRANS